MRHLTLFAGLFAAQLGAQTPRDTAHVRTSDSLIAVKLRAEANRSNVRKTVIRALADTLVMRGRDLLVPSPPPPPPPTNQPPKAAIALSCDPTTMTCSVNGSASTDDSGIAGYAWTFGDGGSAVGVMATHGYTAAGSYPVTLTVRDAAGLTGTASATATLTQQPPPPPPPPAGSVESITGPLVSVASVTALGGVWAQYERDFTQYDDPQWTQCGARWDCIDYYDRAGIYYAWWKRTGDAKYLDRANQVAVNFRDNYLAANNYGIAHHWAMMDGVALHFLQTGDAKSQLAVARVGENFAWQVNGDPSGYFTRPTDMRINAYAIKSLLDAWLIKAPSNGQNTAGWPAVPDWAPVLRSALTKILSLRDADGQWRSAKPLSGTTLVSHPFTVGLLYDALARYYTLFEADPRIPAAIKQSADIMWRDDWVPPGTSYVNPNDGQTYQSVGAFKYVGGPSVEGPPVPAADLNQLIVNGYAFVGKVMGDATFRARADSIFAGGVNSRGVTGDAKHLNQNYSTAFRYLSWKVNP